MPPRTPAEVAAEVARVRAALPPPDATPARIEHIAADAELDVETCIRRLSALTSAGEAWAAVEHGSLYARQAIPKQRSAAAERTRSRFLPPMWVPTPPPKGDAWEDSE